MRYVLPVLLYVAFTVYCVVDILYHREKRPHGLPKVAWLALVVLVAFIGPLSWIVLKFRRPPQTPPVGRQVPPDDDPEYLRWLRDQERRRREGGQG